MLRVWRDPHPFVVKITKNKVDRNKIKVKVTKMHKSLDKDR